MTKEYEAGYDVGKNGPNKKNCHFSLFATSEGAKEWARGNEAAKQAAEKK